MLTRIALSLAISLGFTLTLCIYIAAAWGLAPMLHGEGATPLRIVCAVVAAAPILFCIFMLGWTATSR